MLFIWSGYLKNIGVVLPYTPTTDNIFKKILRHYSCDIFYVREYDFNFIMVYDNQNCNRIFKKHKVDEVVILTHLDLECCTYKIIDGEKVFRRMIPEFIRKKSKSMEGICSVTVVDKEMSDECFDIVDRLCDFCNKIFINTLNEKKGAFLCNKLLEKYGIVADVVDNQSVINTDFIVILDDCGNLRGKNSIIIEYGAKNKNKNVVNDFYIPFKIKPPFGMSCVTFEECLETIKVVDIQ